eukprot:gene22722-biopygen2769
MTAACRVFSAFLVHFAQFPVSSKTGERSSNVHRGSLQCHPGGGNHHPGDGAGCASVPPPHPTHTHMPGRWRNGRHPPPTTASPRTAPPLPRSLRTSRPPRGPFANGPRPQGWDSAAREREGGAHPAGQTAQALTCRGGEVISPPSSLRGAELNPRRGGGRGRARDECVVWWEWGGHHGEAQRVCLYPALRAPNATHRGPPARISRTMRWGGGHDVSYLACEELPDQENLFCVWKYWFDGNPQSQGAASLVRWVRVGKGGGV